MLLLKHLQQATPVIYHLNTFPGNYHKAAHFLRGRRSAEGGSSSWQLNESSAFPLVIHHWAEVHYVTNLSLCTFHSMHILPRPHSLPVGCFVSRADSESTCFPTICVRADHSAQYVSSHFSAKLKDIISSGKSEWVFCTLTRLQLSWLAQFFGDWGN